LRYMRITFDLRRVGLGNNGGSSTLVKSGNTLVDMGHEVIFVDSMKNKYKWTPLKAKHMVRQDNKNLPDADVIIASGYKSVSRTMKSPSGCGIKSHWIRAWEYWQYSEKDIIDRVLKPDTVKLVNSICLQKKLKKYGVDSHIIRPGYDFDQLYPIPNYRKKGRVVIGGLYRAGTHGRRKRTQWLFEAANHLKRKNSNVEFWLFGSEADPGNSIIDIYLRSPSMEDKNKFYNSVDIWMAPTQSEGLHDDWVPCCFNQC